MKDQDTNEGFERKCNKVSSPMFGNKLWSIVLGHFRINLLIVIIVLFNLKYANYITPDTRADVEAVRMACLSCASDPYAPATTLTTEEMMQITANVNADRSKSVMRMNELHAQCLQYA